MDDFEDDLAAYNERQKFDDNNTMNDDNAMDNFNPVQPNTEHNCEPPEPTKPMSEDNEEDEDDEDEECFYKAEEEEEQ